MGKSKGNWEKNMYPWSAFCKKAESRKTSLERERLCILQACKLWMTPLV